MSGNNNNYLCTVISHALTVSSGGHLNPAVTLGVFVAGGINGLAMLFYWLAQIIGSIMCPCKSITYMFIYPPYLGL